MHLYTADHRLEEILQLCPSSYMYSIETYLDKK